MNSKFTSKQYDFFDAIAYNRQVIREKFNNEDKLVTAINAKEVIGSFKIIGSAYKTSNSDVYNMRKIIKENYSNILRNKRISYTFKMKYMLFILSPYLFNIIKRFAYKK